jgi:hypothetical protein
MGFILSNRVEQHSLNTPAFSQLAGALFTNFNALAEFELEND